MNVDDYLSEGVRMYGQGMKTDGCTLVGWFVHRYWPELEQACWAHDFARRGWIDGVETQRENDNLFKDALKRLGAPPLLRFVMYAFTRTQGWFQDKLNMRFDAFLGFVVFLSFVAFAFLYSCDARAEFCGVKWVAPSDREDGTPLVASEIDHYEIWIDGEKTRMYPTGTMTKYAWYQWGPCKKCPDVRMRAVDTDGRMSELSDPKCPPLPPGVCN